MPLFVLDTSSDCHVGSPVYFWWLTVFLTESIKHGPLVFLPGTVGFLQQIRDERMPGSWDDAIVPGKGVEISAQGHASECNGSGGIGLGENCGQFTVDTSSCHRMIRQAAQSICLPVGYNEQSD